MKRLLQLSAVGILIGFSGCMTAPVGPRVAVMPAVGKPFELFVDDENSCRSFASHQTGITADQASQNAFIQDSAAGVAIGAIAGTAIGALVGDPGVGAIAGAGLGGLNGTAIGASAGYHAGMAVQQQYDIAFEQCMYAKGNQIPGMVQNYYPAPGYGSSAFPPPPPPRG